jgi:hypothetical protein
VKEFLAFLSAKGCALVLHRVFSYPVEIFSSSIWVTIKPQSIFLSPGNVQDFNTGHHQTKEYFPVQWKYSGFQDRSLHPFIGTSKDSALRNLFEPFQFSTTTTPNQLPVH